MRRHRLLLLWAMLGCGATTAPHPTAVAPAGVSVDSILATLTVRQKAAQLVMPFLPGAYAALDDSEFQVAARWVDSLEVGGVIVSVGSPCDIAAKLNTLQQRSRLPLLVSADLEWGAGMRLLGGTAFPMIMAVGATGEPRDAYAIGEDPRAVARLVQEYVRGLQDHGMLATLKHFPGQGDTRQDSHISLPVITADYPRLDSLELVP